MPASLTMMPMRHPTKSVHHRSLFAPFGAASLTCRRVSSSRCGTCSPRTSPRRRHLHRTCARVCRSSQHIAAQSDSIVGSYLCGVFTPCIQQTPWFGPCRAGRCAAVVGTVWGRRGDARSPPAMQQCTGPSRLHNTSASACMGGIRLGPCVTWFVWHLRSACAQSTRMAATTNVTLSTNTVIPGRPPDIHRCI
jgi:hypothetical protein